MRRVLARISPVLRLTRITAAFAAVSNVWFVVLWSRTVPGEDPGALAAQPLWILLLGGTASAVGLYAFGAALNDILDLRRDRRLRPERPLASGSLGVEAAIWIVAVTLLLAVLGATPFGTAGVVTTIVVAAAVLGFNAAARFVPGVGIVLLGLIYAGQMLVPNVHMRFLVPVLLVMTHTLVVAGLAYATAKKVPRLTPRATFAAVVGWVSWCAVLLGLGWWRSASGDAGRSLWPAWVDGAAGIVPAALLVGFLVFLSAKLKSIGQGPRAAEKIWRHGSLWLPFYGCAWMLGAGHGGAALALGGLAIIGVVGATVLRELYGLLEQPVGFRV
ncbi:MAG: hypothetical protein KDA05_00950 [Phycisphaerales bacterium]|nr:hypothetical protein [Phycisphaerales bacterium]